MGQQVIGEYTLIERLGQGGMGAVYKAEKTGSDESRLNRYVALKLVLPEYAQKPEFISRFKREAQTIVDLSPHPHIVPLIDYEYSEQDGAYLVMEYMNGGTLNDWIKHDGALSLHDTARIYKQICSALARAHKANIIHRDIKPSNIFLDEDNNAYLGDFGIARHNSMDGAKPTSDVAGTFGYAAPEQIIEDEQNQLTIAADIYSAGIVLYECLTGQHPFSRTSPHNIFQSVPVLPRTSIDFPQELDVIIAKATQIEPTERYGTILALDDALQLVASRKVALPINIAKTKSHGIFKAEETLTDFVFISHSSRDDETVERICEYLEKNGIDVWADHRYLDPGENWDTEIQKRLNSCAEGIVVLSANSLASQECIAEWRAILARGKMLYPLVIDEIDSRNFPYRLEMVQFLDLREDFNDAMEKLVNQIKNNRQTILSPHPDAATEVDSGLPSTVVITPVPPTKPLHEITSIVHDAIFLDDVEDIPLRADEFLGREQLLGAIEQALVKKRKVLLQGFGGVGKTTLAAEYTSRHIAADKGYVLWLKLGNNTAISGLNSLIRALEPSNAENYSQMEMGKQRLRELIADTKVNLIILDDVWSDGHELKSLVDALPSSVSVLLTSRQRYPLTAIIDVDVLALDEALALLSYHASQEFSKEDTVALNLCATLGNHPLALEIAGRTMMVDYLMAEDLLRRIETAPHLMQMPENYSEEGRESIKDLLDASLVALDSNASEVFLSYGLFPETSLSAELIAACLGQSIEDIRQRLTNLLRRGLAKPERQSGTGIVRYTIHSLAHSYAHSNRQLDKKHAIQAVKTYVDNQLNDVDALDAERNNILKIAEQAYTAGQLEDFLHIIYALTVSSDYLRTRGYVDLLLKLMDKAIDSTRERGEKERLHYLLGRRADAYSRQGRYDAAIPAYEGSIQMADELNLLERAVVVRSVASRSYVMNKQFDKASEVLDAAEPIVDKIKENQDESRAWVLEGRFFLVAERDGIEAAMSILEVQVELAKKSNNKELLFHSLVNLAVARSNLENFAQAKPHLDHALRLAKEENSKVWEAIAERALGLYYFGLGEHKEAQKTLNLACMKFKELNYLGDVEELENFMKEQGYNIVDTI